MRRIFLSPSRQYNNTYAAGNTNEGVQCERIAKAAEDALTRCGFEVFNGARWASYADRVRIAKENAVSLYMPIHTNASPKHNVSGTRMFVRSFDEEPSITYCRKIFKYLDAVCPGKSSNIKTYKSLWEFKNTEGIPAVYAECEFHDVASNALWIISHVDEIGEAIARGICDCFDVEYIEPAPAFKVGDAVRIKGDATTYKGNKRFSSWVYRTKMYVRQINGGRVVFSIYKTGAITGTTDIKNLVHYK